MNITLSQARRFLLTRHGLLGVTPFKGKRGVLEYVRLVGGVQFDPVDLCGKSHELALFARVRGFTPEMLDTLLYRDRALIDYLDKNMCLLRTEDWPYFAGTRAWYRDHSRSKEQIDQIAPEVRRRLHELGNATAQELELPGRVDWYWSETTLSRAALETLYLSGELAIHHKTGAVKSYALASACLPQALLNAPDPCPDKASHERWQVLRRVGAIGLLWDRPSDAWLGMGDFHAQDRKAAFAALTQQGRLRAVDAEGVPLYVRAEEAPLLQACAKPSSARRHVRFLPPLDCLLWDRRLIDRLFGFAYAWEIYTPAVKRRYAPYVLPVLYGERFAGRVELRCDRARGVLEAKRFWPENDFRSTAAFDRAMACELERLRVFHGLTAVETTQAFLAGEPALP